MKFLCVVEKDGKILLPAIIQQQFPQDKRSFITLECDEASLENCVIKEANIFRQEGIPIPYEALEESKLMDENHLRILVMDRAIIVTCEDKVLEMMAGECFR